MNEKKAEKKSLKIQAYESLKNKIIECEYAPGSMLNEAEIASQLGFSRTPIREAISILEMEGFLSIVPKKGILVTDILLGDIVQIFQARMEIEPLTLKMAGPYMKKEDIMKWIRTFESTESTVEATYKIDMAMHLDIVSHCNNHYIIDMMCKVFDKNRRVIIASNENKAHINEARKEHLEILHCILNENYEQGAVKMRAHIAGCRNAALEFFYDESTNLYSK